MAWSQIFRKSDISLNTVSWGKWKKNTKSRCWPIKANKSSLPTRQMLRQELFWIKKNSWNCWFRQYFFTKTCLTNNYFSHDWHFVILAWVQSWNIFEKLMKLLIPTEFFHKNMTHEQLLFTWLTFRDSSMGTKLKYFWKTHETVDSDRIFSQKHVSRTITFHMMHISWF